MSRTSLVDVLSQEIIDEIIDYLEDDPKSLLSCTQTCREFLPRAQSYLFRSVAIAYPRRDEDHSWSKYRYPPILRKSRIETLHDIVQAHPELPYNIRSLNLELAARPGDGGAWLWEDKRVLHIISVLPRSPEFFPAISILCDGTSDDTSDNGSDDTVDHYPDEMLQQSARFPSLGYFMPLVWAPLIAPFITKLVLFHLEDVPIAVLLICPKLRQLRIDNVSINAYETYGFKECQPHLETLEFYDSSEAVDKIFGLANSDGPHLDPSVLRTLDVSPQKRNPIDCLPRLMRAAGSSLEKLVIDDLDCHPQLSIFFDLHELPALRTLCVKCALYNVYYAHPFDGLSELFGSSGQSTKLEKIEVITNIDRSLSLFGHEWWEADHPGWARFDQGLDNLTSLSGFKGLSVRIHFVRLGNGRNGDRDNLQFGQEWEAEVATLDHDRLPLAHRNPIVSFVCSFDVEK